MLAPLIALLSVFALGMGLWMSALNVKYRDIRYALPFLVQLWMFASPIIYPSSMLSDKWRWLLALNPLTGIIEGFRASLFGQPGFNWTSLSISGGITLVSFSYAVFSFRRMEKGFADII
jgi:lipopolysaccharide transport system permease protein